jgi:hypothetical protein
MIKMTLKETGIPVPLIYQPIYKIVILLAILKYGTRRPYTAPLVTLHVYMWALRTDQNYKVLHDLANGTRNSIVPWSFEPGLEQIINIAVVNGFCLREPKQYALEIKLSSSGEKILQEIEALEVFTSDFKKIKALGIIPKSKIANANKNWSLK